MRGLFVHILLLGTLYGEEVEEKGPRFMHTINKLADDGFKTAAKTAQSEALLKANPRLLSDDQRMAIYFYTSSTKLQDAVEVRLRNGQGTGEYQDFLDLLLEGLRDIGTSGPLTVRRIIKGRQIRHSDGDILIWKTFVSVSFDLGTDPPCQQVSTIYDIKKATVYNVKDYSADARAAVAIFPPNTQIKIKSKPEICDFQNKYEAKFSGSERASLFRCASFINFVIVAMLVTY